MRFIKRISGRGTLTLPSEVRDALNVNEGDIVEIELLSVIKRNGTPLPPPPGPEPDLTKPTLPPRTADRGLPQ